MRTPGGRVRCGRVIVAVDGRLERLLPALEGRVRTARLQMVATAPLPEIRFPGPSTCATATSGGSSSPTAASRWAASATAAATPSGRTTPSRATVQGMIDGFLRGTLGVHAPITHRWAASVGYTDDGLPVLDEVEPGVWACGGYSGTGNVIGAICGRAAAQLAVTGRRSWQGCSARGDGVDRPRWGYRAITGGGREGRLMLVASLNPVFEIDAGETASWHLSAG